jgi:Sigma-70, region 4
VSRPDEAFETAQAVAVVHEALAVLRARDRAIIEARFGFDGPKRTLAALAKEHGGQRERIRQIEARALRKLAASPERRRALYAALGILGGHPRPTETPGNWRYQRLAMEAYERQERERLAQIKQRRLERMLELDAERARMGDDPSYQDFKAYLARWEAVSWTSDTETNAFVNASDLQLERRRDGLTMAGQAFLASRLTPARRDAVRADHGLPPYRNQIVAPYHPRDWRGLFVSCNNVSTFQLNNASV